MSLMSGSAIRLVLLRLQVNRGGRCTDGTGVRCGVRRIDNDQP